MIALTAQTSEIVFSGCLDKNYCKLISKPKDQKQSINLGKFREWKVRELSIHQKPVASRSTAAISIQLNAKMAGS